MTLEFLIFLEPQSPVQAPVLIAPPAIPYTCRELKTKMNDDGGGNSVYLDRHDAKCGFGEAISSFRINRNGGHNKYQIVYKCCKTPVTYTPQKKETKNTDDGSGSMVFLDRQNIQCGKNYLIQFKMSRKSGGGQYRFSYTCGGFKEGGEVDVKAQNTNFNDDGGGNTVYLDRHKVECPELYSLSQWTLKRNAPTFGKIRFEYTCIKASPIPSKLFSHLHII